MSYFNVSKNVFILFYDEDIEEDLADFSTMFFNGTIISIHQNERNLPIPIVIYVMQEILCYFPLIFSFLGFIGFLGNVLTFIQPELRSNSCCIYIFCSSMTDFIHLMINVFPEYLQVRHGYSLPWNQSVHLCKLIFFLSNFLQIQNDFFSKIFLEAKTTEFIIRFHQTKRCHVTTRSFTMQQKILN